LLNIDEPLNFLANMKLENPSTTKDLPSGNKRTLRARSLRSSLPFKVAVFFFTLHFFSLIVLMVAVIIFLAHPSPLAIQVSVATLIFSVVTWLFGFFKRRNAHCPLCKGTPLIHSGARTHPKATRIFPLDHGISAILTIVTTQRFCCMYCGSDFDLLKMPSHLRG
jgi:hypothetical protein